MQQEVINMVAKNSNPMNIVYINQVPYVTDKETFPTLPNRKDKKYKICSDDAPSVALFDSTRFHADTEKMIADFIRDHCSPIVEESQQRVKHEIQMHLITVDPAFEIRDHTIYKVEGLELEKTSQMRRKNTDDKWTSIAHWFREELHEYRRAFRVVETKTIWEKFDDITEKI